MSDEPHVVVVDDDQQIRSLLTKYLQRNGFRSTAVPDARGLDRVLASQHTDLIVLDVMLPGEDGLSICRRLRVDDRVPIIMLTARSGDVDRILGLEMGADDYLTKPFHARELVARIRNVLLRFDSLQRSAAPRPGSSIRFAGWTFDTVSRSLVDPEGCSQALAGAEYDLLMALISNANRVLTRDQLMELTKGREAQPFDRSIDVRVSRLRQRLRDDGREPRIIKSVYGKGYVFSACVAVG